MWSDEAEKANFIVLEFYIWWEQTYSQVVSYGGWVRVSSSVQRLQKGLLYQSRVIDRHGTFAEFYVARERKVLGEKFSPQIPHRLFWD
jgi:hypothetical protein